MRSRFRIVPYSHVKLYDRHHPNAVDRDAYEIMRQVVYRRLEAEELKPETIIAPDVLNLLIKGSGGVMRDLIRLMQFATLEAELAGKDSIEEPEAKRVLNELRRQLMAQLTPDYHEVLQHVRDTHQRASGDESEKCDLMLRKDTVLSYVNDDIWFDAHAALTPEPW